MCIVIYEKKSKIYIFSLKTPMYPKWWVNFFVWVFKNIYFNYLTIPTYVPNLEVLLTAKRF